MPVAAVVVPRPAVALVYADGIGTRAHGRANSVAASSRTASEPATLAVVGLSVAVLLVLEVLGLTRCAVACRIADVVTADVVTVTR